MRKSRDEIKKDTYIIDYGSISEEPGKSPEQLQEQMDIDAQYYGAIILALSIIFEIFIGLN